MSPLLLAAVLFAVPDPAKDEAFPPHRIADDLYYVGSKNLGLNYGLVFLGWGVAFFVPQIGGFIQDATGSLDAAFYLSAGLLTVGVVMSRLLKRPDLGERGV